jgi:hypothetical protein
MTQAKISPLGGSLGLIPVFMQQSIELCQHHLKGVARTRHGQ